MTATVLALDDRRQSRASAGRVGVVAPASALARAVMAVADVQWHTASDGGGAGAGDQAASPVETLVYVPRPLRAPDMGPDLAHARAALTASHRTGTRRLVLVSSTLIYGASPRHSGLAIEQRVAQPGQAIGAAWR